jgi:hypothetical protein
VAEELKLCKDCKFCVGSTMYFADVGAQCSRDVYVSINRVTGSETTRGYYNCNDQRSVIGECGERARFFQPREKKPKSILEYIRDKFLTYETFIVIVLVTIVYGWYTS